jgi:hypothetical protein
MTTAAPSTALATIQPAFTGAERLALTGYLAGYRGLTREAYSLDLRQFTTWCPARSLALIWVLCASATCLGKPGLGGAAGCGRGSRLAGCLVLSAPGALALRRDEEAQEPDLAGKEPAWRY